MNAAEICPLTRDAVADLLFNREATTPDDGRRRLKRWPFPGTVELWLPEEDGTERYELATALDMSLHGVGIRCDEPLPPGMELGIAIHEPEISFHGRAVVRHCTEIEEEYLAGVEFVFDPE